jgi:hypothetical protein
VYTPRGFTILLYRRDQRHGCVGTADTTWDELDQLPKAEFDELLLEHKLGVLERQRVNAVDAKRRMVAPSTLERVILDETNTINSDMRERL